MMQQPGSWRARLAGVLLVTLAACGSQVNPEDEARMAQSDLTTLEVTDTTPGTGAEAVPGRRVVVHYTGWLYHRDAADHRGRKFDSSRDRSEPFEFGLGAGEVIPGWDEGVRGMKVGGRRVLTIPPALAYGPRGAGGVIPGNATLVFDIELLDVR
jgi:FKBP-type peptidyl-prolyl cis-trans isomerase FkpA